MITPSVPAVHVKEAPRSQHQPAVRRPVPTPQPAPVATVPRAERPEDSVRQAMRGIRQLGERTTAAAHAAVPFGQRPDTTDRTRSPKPRDERQPDQPRAYGFSTEVNNRSWHDRRKNVDATIEVQTPDGAKHTLTDKIDIQDESGSYEAKFHLEHDGKSYEYRVPFEVEADPDSRSAPHSVKPGKIEVSTDDGAFEQQRPGTFDREYRAAKPKVEVDRDARKAEVSLDVRDEHGEVHQLHGELEIPYRFGQEASQLEQSVVVSGTVDGTQVRYEVPVSIDIERRTFGEWDAGMPRNTTVETGKPQRIG